VAFDFNSTHNRMRSAMDRSHGVAATYHPQAGADLPITVYADADAKQDDPATEGRRVGSRVVVRVRKSDVASARANGDAVTVPAALARPSAGAGETVRLGVAAVLEPLDGPMWRLRLNAAPSGGV
jgi:hypothetical protein